MWQDTQSAAGLTGQTGVPGLANGADLVWSDGEVLVLEAGGV